VLDTREYNNILEGIMNFDFFKFLKILEVSLNDEII
jgi:hypothetical protein